MKVGDLVRYRYGQQDLGIIIETVQETNEHTPKFKVMWVGFRNGTNFLTDWMRPTGLEVISESR
jgi:glucan biosynthesis protein